MSTFTYEYVWVNDGEWRSTDSWQDSLSKARNAAFRQGVAMGSELVEARIVLNPCLDGHVDICDHLTVTLTLKES